MRSYCNRRISELARFFKSCEIFSKLRIPFGKFLIVRCDGRNFSSLTKDLGLKKLDERFHKIMIETAIETITKSGFDIRVAYVMSDEMSFFFKEIPFSARVEKIDSVIASFVSSAFTIRLRENFDFRQPIAFDARVIVLDSLNDVVYYFIWRQKEAWRNFLNAMAQWILLQEGYDREVIYHKLYGMKSQALIKFLEKKGINIKKEPNWKKFGILIFKFPVLKEALNPITKKQVQVIRFKIGMISKPFNANELHELIQKSLLSRIEARKLLKKVGDC